MATGGSDFGAGGQSSTGGSGSFDCERSLEEVAEQAQCPEHYCPGGFLETCDWLYVSLLQCGGVVGFSWSSGFVGGTCYYYDDRLIGASYFSDDAPCSLSGGTLPVPDTCSERNVCGAAGAAGMGGQDGSDKPATACDP